MTEASSSQELATELAALRQRVAELETEVQLQEHLKIILDHLPYRVWLKDINGIHVAINRQFCQATGKTIQEILGKTDLELWKPSDAERFRQEDLDLIAAPAASVLEQLVTTVDGGERWFSTTKNPVYTATGELLGIAGVSFDITDRKNAEIALENLKDELEARVSDRTAALEDRKSVV